MLFLVLIEHKNGRNMNHKLQCQMIASVHFIHIIRGNIFSCLYSLATGFLTSFLIIHAL